MPRINGATSCACLYVLVCKKPLCVCCVCVGVAHVVRDESSQQFSKVRIKCFFRYLYLESSTTTNTITKNFCPFLENMKIQNFHLALHLQWENWILLTLNQNRKKIIALIEKLQISSQLNSALNQNKRKANILFKPKNPVQISQSLFLPNLFG